MLECYQIQGSSVVQFTTVDSPATVHIMLLHHGTEHVVDTFNSQIHVGVLNHCHAKWIHHFSFGTVAALLEWQSKYLYTYDIH